MAILKNIQAISGILFKMETYDTHGFDPETVRYILVNIWGESEGKFIFKDVVAWDLCMLTIDEHDYTSIQSMKKYGLWIICNDLDVLIMLELKYKKYITCVLPQREMGACLNAAKTFLGKDQMHAVSSIAMTTNRIHT